ncbi:hypothetical protein, partial [Stenotrophomonas maltophilia group sp. Smal12]|uniref:hypothetical protein n=1 Tax=Stenotrophomonas maltophilia group sp. Smal12 TaxID=3050414 RepID=UPI00300E7F9F
ITCFTASARNSSVYCLLLPINTSVIAINYGNRMSTKGWPVHAGCNNHRNSTINNQMMPDFNIQHYVCQLN